MFCFRIWELADMHRKIQNQQSPSDVMKNYLIDKQYFVIQTIKTGKFGAMYQGIDIISKPPQQVLIKALDIQKLKQFAVNWGYIIQKEVKILKNNKPPLTQLLHRTKTPSDCPIAEFQLLITTSSFNSGTLEDEILKYGSLELDHAAYVIKNLAFQLYQYYYISCIDIQLLPTRIWKKNGKYYFADFGIGDILQNRPCANLNQIEASLSIQDTFQQLGLLLYAMLEPDGKFQQRKIKAKKQYQSTKTILFPNSKQANFPHASSLICACLSRKMSWKIFSKHQLFQRMEEEQIPSIFLPIMGPEADYYKEGDYMHLREKSVKYVAKSFCININQSTIEDDYGVDLHEIRELREDEWEQDLFQLLSDAGQCYKIQDKQQCIKYIQKIKIVSKEHQNYLKMVKIHNRIKLSQHILKAYIKPIQGKIPKKKRSLQEHQLLYLLISRSQHQISQSVSELFPHSSPSSEWNIALSPFCKILSSKYMDLVRKLYDEINKKFQDICQLLHESESKYINVIKKKIWRQTKEEKDLLVGILKYSINVQRHAEFTKNRLKEQINKKLKEIPSMNVKAEVYEKILGEVESENMFNYMHHIHIIQMDYQAAELRSKSVQLSTDRQIFLPKAVSTNL